MSKSGLPITSEVLIVDDEEDIRDLIAGGSCATKASARGLPATATAR